MVLKLFNKNKVYSKNLKIKDYVVLDIVGEGRYGICYLASKNNTKYILKQLKKDLLKKIGNKFEYEENILKIVENDRIPKFIEKFYYDDFLIYSLEFIEGKTFEEIIFEDQYIFSRKEIYSIGTQLIEILKYLHGLSIVHRDIRVPNVIYRDKKVYLVDFGLSRWINDKKYTPDVDFSYLGDFLIHLYYSSFELNSNKSSPWYKELDLFDGEKTFLKRLMGIDQKYDNINEVEKDFFSLIKYDKPL